MKSMYIEDAKKKLLENGMPMAFVESLTTEQLTCYFDVPVTTTKPKELHQLNGEEYIEAAYTKWINDHFYIPDAQINKPHNKLMFLAAFQYGLTGCQNGNIF